MKKAFLLSILLMACDPVYEPIMQLCVNYPGTNVACGTGFFVTEDVILTSAHLIEYSNNAEVTVISEGLNTRTKNILLMLDYDLALVKLQDGDVTDHLDICDSMPALNSDLELCAVLKRRNGVVVDEATLYTTQDGFLYADEEVSPGYSGGPVIDVGRGCALGSISQAGDGLTSASNIVDLQERIFEIIDQW